MNLFIWKARAHDSERPFYRFVTPSQISLHTSTADKYTDHPLCHYLLGDLECNEVAHRLGNTPEMIPKVYGHLMEDTK